MDGELLPFFIVQNEKKTSSLMSQVKLRYISIKYSEKVRIHLLDPTKVLLLFGDCTHFTEIFLHQKTSETMASGISGYIPTEPKPGVYEETT